MLLGHRLKWNTSNIILIYFLVDVWFQHYFLTVLCKVYFSRFCVIFKCLLVAIFQVFLKRGMDPNLEKPSQVVKVVRNSGDPKSPRPWVVPNSKWPERLKEWGDVIWTTYESPVRWPSNELPKKLPTRKTGTKNTHFPQTARRSATSDPKSQPADAEERQLTLGAPGGFRNLEVGRSSSFNGQDDFPGNL